MELIDVYDKKYFGVIIDVFFFIDDMDLFEGDIDLFVIKKLKILLVDMDYVSW